MLIRYAPLLVVGLASAGATFALVGCRSMDGYADCEPGESYLAGCSAAVGRACDGDPNLRVCSDDVSPGDCVEDSSAELGYDDDSGDGLCPEAEFVCPSSGRVAVNVELDDGRDFCVFDLLMVAGPPVGVPATCTAGTRYQVGCTTMLGTECTGDPTLTVCPGDAAACTRDVSIAFNDDSVGRCPAVEFECPAEGSVLVLAAPYSMGTAFTCTYALEEVPSP